MDKRLPMLTIIVPCFNEEEVLPETIKQLTELMNELCEEKLIGKHSRILFVDDGSTDRTWMMIAMESVRNQFVTGIKLARNVGHQKALLAGYLKAREKCDCAISIDADLQDDVGVIKEFMKNYHEGYEIVYGVRKRRDTDSFFKRTTAQGFYRMMKKLGIDLVYNHADFRLLSKRALDELARYPENNLFLRGILPLLGFRSTKVFYDRKERLAGKTKYPLRKMISFALDGLTSFSVRPIRFITIVGIILFSVSILLSSFTIFNHAIFGLNGTVLSLWVLGSLQLIALGTVGEYIGKIFIEVKNRPKYAVEIDLFTKSMVERLDRKIDESYFLKYKS
ncbi:glycosyltransferase family 2 protein [Caldifermentibacillus hisashii]|uniref:glycosyltransferase family 2 protein n=1 Tax=Caldifermentibacillus hisashii TaxID=996558 RepID=UPI001C117163|nr:glycosyltransferase family 2 protein [Caldifermentibacillus hisashii]MBU5341626.1 glycosyltransferase family 2 protein [Caldifermentibacillus hisashii]MDL0421307.1 glycosyltransferase family 2 protein [Caldibacillus thermoamylovorans]MED3643841.1 glycosyltransferase family 2 protein [Caldifermentibacillus hisashii]